MILLSRLYSNTAEKWHWHIWSFTNLVLRIFFVMASEKREDPGKRCENLLEIECLVLRNLLFDNETLVDHAQIHQSSILYCKRYTCTCTCSSYFDYKNYRMYQ
jgi:hypothetical protein